MVLTLIWLLAITALVLFVLWLNRFLQQNFQLPSDTQLLILITFSGAITLGTLSFLWGLDQDRMTDTAVEGRTGQATPLHQQLQQDYPELYQQWIQLQQRIQELNTFFHNVKTWSRDSPTQAKFLQQIVDIRWQSYQRLRQAHKTVSMNLRQYWIMRQTSKQNVRYIEQQFKAQSEILVETMQSALAADTNANKDERQTIIKAIQQAQKQLQHTHIPKDPKNRKAYLAFTPYNDNNREQLQNWLKLRQNMTALRLHTEDLHNNLHNINTSIKEFQKYISAPENADLRPRMRATAQQWLKARHSAQYSEYQVLYAIELMYILDKLTAVQPPLVSNTPVQRQTKALEALYEDLQEMAPRIVQQAREQLTDNIVEAYQPIQPVY